MSIDYSVTFFEKAYIGMQPHRQSYGEDNDYNIGFMIEYDESAACKKRMETVDRWRDKKINPLIEDNKPMTGFKIIGFSTRSYTDNKVARILDPRGFILEIYIDNFDRIMAENDVLKGVVDAELVWGRKVPKRVISF